MTSPRTPSFANGEGVPGMPTSQRRSSTHAPGAGTQGRSSCIQTAAAAQGALRRLRLDLESQSVGRDEEERRPPSGLPPSLRAGLARDPRFQRRGRPQDLYERARPPGGTEAPQGSHTGLRGRGPSRVTWTGTRLLLTQNLTSSWHSLPLQIGSSQATR